MAAHKPNGGVDHDALIADAREGMTGVALARKYKISSSSVSYHLKKEGLAVGSNGRRVVKPAASNGRGGGSDFRPAPSRARQLRRSDSRSAGEADCAA